MTNGEKFQQIFAVSQVDECDLNVYAWLPCHDAIEIPLEWWNANYSEIPTGSTTKNNLGVDCISRTQAQTEIEMNASRYTIAKERGGMGQVEWSDQLIKVSDAVDIIRKLPSVTPQEQRKGHWIPTYGNVKCSICGSVKDSREVGKATHYCDFCGAKMFEPQESENP